MSSAINHLGQPVGAPLPRWRPPPFPSRDAMSGRWCRLEPLNPAVHAAQLFAAHAMDAEGRNWTYLPYGPFAGAEEYTDWMRKMASGSDPLFFAILDVQSRPVGAASFQRIDAANGSIEVGHVTFSPALQRAVAATEAMFLMMRHAFELGYRRYEWKCDSLNAPSRAAAQRLGFTFEGIFRQVVVVKGRNRDTAWFSIIDSEWPSLREAFEKWLDPANFDSQGRQRTRLSNLTRAALAKSSHAR